MVFILRERITFCFNCRIVGFFCYSSARSIWISGFSIWFQICHICCWRRFVQDLFNPGARCLPDPKPNNVQQFVLFFAADAKVLWVKPAILFGCPVWICRSTTGFRFVRGSKLLGIQTFGILHWIAVWMLRVCRLLSYVDIANNDNNRKKMQITVSEHVKTECSVYNEPLPVGPEAPFVLPDTCQLNLHAWVKTLQLQTPAKRVLNL